MQRRRLGSLVDLVVEGFDMALRAGILPDSTLVARRLMDIDLAIVASPTYLAEYGTPNSLDDLKSHNCIVDTVSGYANRWPLTEGKKPKFITVKGNFRVNNGEIVRAMTVAGMGIALLPRFFMHKDLREGRLISLMDGHIDFNAGLFLVYPQPRYFSNNVRNFIDYLLKQMKFDDQ